MTGEIVGSYFNPAWLSDNVLLDSFKARQNEFNFLRDSLAAAPVVGSVQHHLLVGQRGAGKTTLLRRLEIAIRRESELSDHLIALSFPEELYQIKSLDDFWWAACEALAEEFERSGQVDRASRLFDQVDRASTLPQSTENNGLIQLLAVCNEIKRRPVMLVDNLDFVIHRIEMGGRSKHKGALSTTYWALREALSTTTSPIVVGSTVRLSEPFTSVDKAFYDFFLPHRLGKLPLLEVQSMLEHSAMQQGAPQVLTRLQARPARLEALYELTGGNPRAIGLVFKLLSQGPGNSAVEDFEGLMDLMTPYYKARFEDLAEQAQVVMHALATRRSSRLGFGHTGAEIGTHAGLATNTVSAQMDLLVREGLVEKNAEQGRTQYRIAEQLFRLWLQMRGTRRIRQNALGLARYLEALFDLSDLTSGVLDGKGRQGAMLAFAAAEIADDESLRHGLTAHGADLLFGHVKTTGEEFKDYVAIDDIPSDLADSIGLRQQLHVCHGGGLTNTEQLALLGSLTLSPSQKEASVIALCSVETSANEAARLRTMLADEHRQLVLESLLETDLSLLYELRAKGHFRLPSFSPADAEAVRTTYSNLPVARLVWRLIGLRRLFRYTNTAVAEEWLVWGERHAPEASSAEWANVAGSMRLDGCQATAQKVLARAFERGESSRAFHESGSQARDSGRASSEVLKNFYRAIELDPRDPVPWNSLGNYFQNTNKIIESEHAFRKAIELDPKYTGPWTNLGILFQDTKRYREAEKAYQKAIELEPKYAGTWNNLGNLLQEIKRFEEAEKAYRKAIELDPHYLAAINNLGNLFLHNRSFLEAEEAYRNAIKIDSKNAGSWSNLGNVLRRLSRHTEAEDAYRQSIKIDPKFALPWMNIGNLFRELRKFEQAEDAFRRVIELEPTSAESWASLGDTLENTERFDMAETAYLKAIDLDSKSAAYWACLGNLRQKTGQLQAAEKDYRKALEVDPKSALAWTHLGNIFRQTHQFDAAENAYRKAIEFDLDFPGPWNNLGNLLQDLGRFDEAENAYREAISIDSGHPGHWNNLGNVIARTPGRGDEAELTYRHALQLNSSYTIAWLNLAKLLGNSVNRVSDAELAYRKVIELDPKNTTALGYLGELLENNLRYDEARELFKTASILESNSPRWALRLASVIARDIARRAYASLINNRIDELHKVLAEALHDDNDVSALLASETFRDELLIPVLSDGDKARVVLTSMRELGFDKHAKPLMLAMEGAIERQGQALDFLEPELRSATKRIYETLIHHLRH